MPDFKFKNGQRVKILASNKPAEIIALGCYGEENHYLLRYTEANGDLITDLHRWKEEELNDES